MLEMYRKDGIEGLKTEGEGHAYCENQDGKMVE